MDLSTTWLGLNLDHPLVPGASPLTADVDSVRRLEDAGAAAVVMHSLFEEQLVMEQLAASYVLDPHEEAFAEALTSMPGLDAYRSTPEQYLELLAAIKAAVDIPVIASLNGSSPGGWLRFSRELAEAGADAIELNVYSVATEPDDSGYVLEQRTVEMVREVTAAVAVPLAVKLSPYYASLPHFARQLDDAGAGGLVLFNRFYQPDLDLESLRVSRALRLSDSSELPLRLRWIAILSAMSEIHCPLACTGGVHTPDDAVKAVLVGAHAVQCVSTLLRHGPGRLEMLRRGLAEWLERHGFDSLRDARGVLDLGTCPDPQSYERANYMEILQSWD